MIRDQYQGGSTVMTAISGVEIALWDLIGKAVNQPVYRLLGGRCHDAHPGLCQRLVRRGAHAGRLCRAGAGGRGARLSRPQVRPVRDGLEGARPRGRRGRRSTSSRRCARPSGAGVGLMIEFHGRLAAGTATAMIRRLERFHPAWCEEPVAPECLDLLAEVKRSAGCPIAAGERLYTQADFYRLTALRAVDVVQMDLAHCGGILAGKKIAAMAAAAGHPRRAALLDRAGRPGRLPPLRRLARPTS